MKSSGNAQSTPDSAAILNAFRRRMMQIALLDRVGKGLDPLQANRFQALGFFKDVAPPPLPPDLVDLFRTPNQPRRIPLPPGPLMFVKDGEGATVLEIAVLLLQPVLEIRSAALDYFKEGGAAPVAWVTPHTAQLVQTLSSGVLNEEAGRWRAAGIDAMDAIRKDILVQFAGLRQSLAGNFQEGIDQYLEHVIRPGFDELVRWRPELWSPSEQRDELQSWISEFASLPNLESALAQYIERCGYLPLCDDFGAAMVVRQWQAKHTTQPATWRQIWSWADSSDHPAAKYHAIMIALSLPEVRVTDPASEFWTKVVTILDIVDNEEEAFESNWKWRLYCEAATHFARHVEALHPGQHGDRIASYAWWLATEFARLFATTNESAKGAIDAVLEPETEVSLRRWRIARSPVVPSAIRYATLHITSVWAMSILSQLRETPNPIPEEEIPVPLRRKIELVLRGYLLSSPLTDNCEVREPIYAFQTVVPSGAQDGWKAFIPTEEREAFTQIVAYRKRLENVHELQSQLEQLVEMPAYEQHLLLLFLKGVVSAGDRYDESVAAWLAQTDLVVETMQVLPARILGFAIDAITEVQLRQHNDSVIRVPHVLCYALEKAAHLDRVKLIMAHVLVMSINSGIVSPLQRIAASRWRAEVLSALVVWRHNLVEIGRHSQPWVAARARGMSSAISRLIGPRAHDSVTEDVCDAKGN